MTPSVFLDRVLPDAGYYCVATLIKRKGAKPSHKFFTEQSKALEFALAPRTNVNTYFACASYASLDTKALGTETPRVQENVLALRAFWFDLDVGTPKKANSAYPSKEAALLALKDFCAAMELHRPIIVDSGNGIHAYWTLDYAIERDVWQPIADRLKAAAQKHGLFIDASCTADSARIMRMPGTMNFNPPKGGVIEDFEPNEAKVLWGDKHKSVDYADFAAKFAGVSVGTGALPFDAGSIASSAKGKAAEANKGLLQEYPQVAFMPIIEHKRCAQLVYVATHQDEVPEPLWRAGLSIANHCTDREEAIHFISKDHPEYSAKETETKARGTAGPFHCTTFESENPGGCAGCPHQGKVTSPIMLGRQLVSDNQPTQVVDKDATTNDERTYELPTYPWPYVRGANGEVMWTDPGLEGAMPEVVYANPFYAVKRMRDKEVGEMLWLRLHLPQDGVREFSIPLKDIVSSDRFRDAIAAQGVVGSAKCLTHLSTYIRRWTQELQKLEKAELIRTQMGWTPEGTFIIGEREVRKDGVFYSPPSRATANVCGMLVKRGDLAVWRKTVNYYNNPGYEIYAFILFLGFGSPLLRFTGVEGGVVNIFHEESGLGKSAAQMTANSIWGHPKDMMATYKDTHNAIQHRMGVYQNISLCIEELTKLSADTISDILYSSTLGRGKNRMHSQTNAERVNDSSWCSITITSSNKSLSDTVRSLSEAPDGELMRLLEFSPPEWFNKDKMEKEHHFAPLRDNYGLAGEVFMQYVIKNMGKVSDGVKKVQAKLFKTAGLTQRERFWVSIVAVAIVGGSIARSLGLHDIDVERVSKWVVAHLAQARTEMTSDDTPRGVSALARFIDTHLDEVLIIRDKGLDGLPAAPIKEPRARLAIRMEPDTRRIYINVGALRSWCTEHRISYSTLTGDLMRAGVEVEVVKKRMNKGTAFPAPPANALCIYDEQGTYLLDSVDDKPKTAA